MIVMSHRAVDEYLGRLRRSMSDLPAERRDEIVSEIEEHIAGMLAEREGTMSDADVRNVLERLGEPDTIAAEARERFGIRPAKPQWTDTAAVVLLVVGGFVPPIIGWVVGVVLLWISDVWSTRDKIIGTLVVPGGVAGGLGIAGALVAIAPGATISCRVVGSGLTRGSCVSHPTSWTSVLPIVLAVVLVIAPMVTAFYLGRKLHRARLASKPS